MDKILIIRVRHLKDDAFKAFVNNNKMVARSVYMQQDDFYMLEFTSEWDKMEFTRMLLCEYKHGELTV